MNISQAGISLIKSFEGCILQSYDDYNDRIINAGDVVRGTLTIGWGLTQNDLPNLYKGMRITQEEADNLFAQHLVTYSNHVNRRMEQGYFGFEMNQNRFDALTSFCYNAGAGNLDMLCQAKRDAQTVADKMLEYRNKGTQWEQGLLRRRNAERAMFLGTGNEATPNVTVSGSSISTSDVIKQLQHQINIQGFGNIAEDGIFGPETLSHLPTLRVGTQGEITKWLQLRIMPANQADGIFGSHTKEALQYMQNKYKIAADGVCGRITWSYICRDL